MRSTTPVPLTERHQILDVLRGFALLGVMLDNLFGFTGWAFSTDAQKQSYPTWTTDAILATLEQVFINGKFYSIFSLLFGIGFSIILVRNEAKGINPLKIFYRRLFVLLLIGAIHLFVFWEGDILMLYAMIGMVLPLFRKMTDKTLITIAITLILSPLVIDLISVLTQVSLGAGLEGLATKIDQHNGLPLDKEGYATYLYKEGAGWREWRNWELSGWAYRYSYILHSNRIPKVLALFLLGFVVGRNMMFAKLEEHIGLLKKLRFWGLLIGIPMGIVSFYFEIFRKGVPNPEGLIHTAAYALSVVPMALAYASIICLYWHRKNGQTRLRFLAPVGQMALTNYLMQTFFGISIYYGVGLGLGGNIGPTIFIPAGIMVYLIQILYSNWWMRHFRFGPMEWIWRQLTYGKSLPIRK
ncbi:MAG: DUF418 domain-containing protein [Chitinophagaceae bacterium]